ncbi:MAG: MotA/TolQ/ExbB proton channel family protein [Deltaproteobacteria bacterium]|nr:MotA/TolQ/ExbB proton channel family protein [Deltaproteobacteria bacterium]
MNGAGWVMWLLVGLSIIGFAIAMERAYTLARASEHMPSLGADLKRLLDRRDLEAAKARLARSRSFEARVISAGLGATPAAAEETMTSAVQLAKLQMEKRLAFLGTLGANAPFIGLLGTVIGIVRSFHMLQSSGGNMNAGLMAEVGSALVATAIGILVALPAVAFFNAFQRVIKARLARAEALGRELITQLPTA